MHLHEIHDNYVYLLIAGLFLVNMINKLWITELQVNNTQMKISQISICFDVSISEVQSTAVIMQMRIKRLFCVIAIIHKICRYLFKLLFSGLNDQHRDFEPLQSTVRSIYIAKYFHHMMYFYSKFIFVGTPLK